MTNVPITPARSGFGFWQKIQNLMKEMDRLVTQANITRDKLRALDGESILVS
jgi:hypothetical protein